jgi:coenzyme Q-binding protein COQ10
MVQRLLFVLSLFFVATPAFAFDTSRLDAETLQSLAGDGQLVVVEENKDGSLKLVTAGSRIEAPLDKVWAQITDYETYGTWMPQVERVEIRKRTGNQVDVFFDLAFKFSVISKEVTYTLRQIESPKSSIRWFLVDGDFSVSRGSWHLVPVADGSATLVFYSTDLVSMGWIVKTLLEEQPSMELAIQASTAVMVVKSLKMSLENTK